MLGIILTIIVGLLIAFFALQNTTLVTVQLANYTLAQVPLYLVMIISLLVGIFVAWLISLVDSISSYMKIFGKDRKIVETQKTVADLNQKIHQLEVENAHLKERAVAATFKEPINKF